MRGGAGDADTGEQQQQQRKHAFWATQPVPQAPDAMTPAPAAGASAAAATAASGAAAAAAGAAAAAAAGATAAAAAAAAASADAQSGVSASAVASVNEPIEVKTLEDVRKEPYALPPQLCWDMDFEVEDVETMKELFELLHDNYVTDEDGTFRFAYAREMLLWAVKPPGWRKEWHVAVRVKKPEGTGKGRLVAFIAATPARVCVRGKEVPMVEIDFLCVHRKLREHRLAPRLIQEVTRRVNLTGVWQALYTAGIEIPTPFAKCRYFHRSLNPAKLVDVGFSHVTGRMTVKRMIKLYALPTEPQLPGFRMARPEDVPHIQRLLMEYLPKKTQIYQVFDDEEARHWFTPMANVVYVYVVEDPETHEITDFCSFYSLPSSISGNPRYNMLHAAFSFYNVASKHPLPAVMRDALIMAKREGFDVFNALDLMENKVFLSDPKFAPGDGFLHYYLYNWKTPRMQTEDVGTVLI